MKLLLDANVSWRLAASLKNHFTDCLHVDHIGLSIPAKDIEIWEFTSLHKLTIDTNDEDFLNLINIKGYPPKVVLLKTGNQHNNYIEGIIIKHKNDILMLEQSEETGLLEIY